MKEFPEIKLNNIILRKLTLEDYDNYLDYVLDSDISKQFSFNYDNETAKKRLEEIVAKYESEKMPYIWAIALIDTNELVGIISLDSVSFRNKSFSMACGIRNKYRNNGYAYEAGDGLARFIFNNYDMNRLQLSCLEENQVSIKMFEKAGLVFEGVAREAKYYDGKFKNKRIYSILKSEIKNLE